MDDGFASDAVVQVNEIGLVVVSLKLGSCKYGGESYTARTLVINHPSHHTIEGVQADGEVIVYFEKPTGELLCMSILFRVNSAQTPSYSLFKQFVPYAVPNETINLKLNEFSIAALVPPQASYYVYSGTLVIPPCTPTQWIVFKQMINMDQGDFAYLVRNVEAGSRPIQGLGDREVFFNDSNNIPGGPTAQDGRLYMRLRPSGDSKLASSKPTAVNLKDNKGLSDGDKAEEAKNPTTITGQFKSMYEKYGALSIIIGGLTTVAICVAIYFGYSGAEKTPYTAEFGKPAAAWTRTMLLNLWTYTLGLISWLYNNTIGLIPELLSRAQKAVEEKAKQRAAATPKAESAPTPQPQTDSSSASPS